MRFTAFLFLLCVVAADNFNDALLRVAISEMERRPLEDIQKTIAQSVEIARKFGVDHVAIGTDNGMPPLNDGDSEMPAMPKTRPIWEQFWTPPGAGYELMTKEQYDSVLWLNWPMYTVGLVQRGFTDDEIRKIIGGNVLRVITEILEK